jgi:uncharacterized peroxidase-related enzyme
MAWINIIEKDEANSNLKDVYNEIISKRGKLSNIMKIHSLNPGAMRDHMNLYLSIMFGKSNLKREERELIAVIVSSVNKCDYCINHHAEALNFYWKDSEKIKRVIDNPQSIDLSEKTKKMVDYVSKLTSSPYDITEDELNLLRKVGFSDKDILDINLITSYFNFVNRIALGLGVEFSEDEIKGYKY